MTDRNSDPAMSNTRRNDLAHISHNPKKRGDLE